MASEEDDLLYDHNVKDGIEIGSDMTDARTQGVVISVGKVEDDDLEY